MSLFLLLSLWTAALSPEAVVKTVVDALRNNNSPMPNAGVFTAYRFASPENHALTGPYGRFLRLVKSPDFEPMLRAHSGELGAIEVTGDRAEQSLRIRLDGGQSAVYRFNLSRQKAGAFRGNWMVDGVARLQ